MKSLNLSKIILQKMYIQNKKSTYEIARKLECSSVTVAKYLKIYKIPRRTFSEARKGKFKRNNHPQYKDGRCFNIYRCKEKNCKNKINYRTFLFGLGRCKHCSRLALWQNKNFREKTLKASLLGQKRKPNKPEKLLRKFLNKLLPKEYKFVGDGKVILGGFNPDFINCNGQKKIIELYGDYWHNRIDWTKRDKRRLIAYKKYGYKTLIVWEHELKNLDKLNKKIIGFNL